MNFTEYLPSLMSAVASIAAAIAAFLSLIVSKQSKKVAMSSILADNHRQAAVELSLVLSNIHTETKQLSEFTYIMWASWATEIGQLDDRSAAGVDPELILVLAQYLLKSRLVHSPFIALYCS